MAIERGTISTADHVVKYDDEGIEYWVYTIVVDQKTYTSRIKKGNYLIAGSPIVFEAEGGTIVAGYCSKEDIGWGKDLRKLKQQLDPSDKFEYVEGVVVEKRKQVSKTTDFSRNYMQRAPGVGYTVVLEDRSFHATSHFGEPLKAGMPIAVVLQQNDAVLLRIASTGKLYGYPKPTYIVWILALAAFNATMFYLYKTGRTEVINFNSVLIVINVFLVLATVMSIAGYVMDTELKRFYQTKALGHRA